MNDGVLSELAGPSRPLSLAEAGRLVGALLFVEEQAFHTLGELSTTVDVRPPVRLLAAAAARGHAWRVAQLAELLPVSAGLPGRGELVRAPSRKVAAFAAEPAGVLAAAPEQASGVLEAFYETLRAAYEARLGHLHEGADGALARTFGRLVSSLTDQLSELRRLETGNRLGA